MKDFFDRHAHRIEPELNTGCWLWSGSDHKPDGNGFVSLGRSSSDLSKTEFSDLFNVIEAWAASKGVELSDPASSTKEPAAPNKAAGRVAA